LLILGEDAAQPGLLTEIVRSFGFGTADVLADARAVFADPAHASADLIVLDHDQIGAEGFEIVRRLAEGVPWGSFRPVLVLTSDVRAETKTNALAAGAADLLTKPYDSSEVFMRMRNLLQMRFLHRQLQDQNATLESTVAERTRELRESQQQIITQERLRAFSEMAGGIVHDFNNALMSVIGYTEIMLSDDDGLRDVARTRRLLKIMNAAGQEASHSIGRLRDFYRPRELTDFFERVNLNSIVEEAVPLTQPRWKAEALAEGRAIRIDFDLAKVSAILGNLSDLREIATNLIFNAVDAMPQGGTITLRTGDNGTHVFVEVIDTGVGMSDEVRRRCFEPFFTTKGKAGTGLGLSMVFGIVKRHDGDIEIETEPGKGTTFRVRFPAYAAACGADETLKIGRSLRILVVDDEPVSRAVLEKYLMSDGHTVETAVDAEDAISRLCASRFDLLITDHAMPGMNGVQLAGMAQGIRAGHPVILVTGFADLPGAGVEPEIETIIRKPVPRRELQRAVVTAMAQ